MLQSGKLCCTGFLRIQNATIFPKNVHFFATVIQVRLLYIARIALRRKLQYLCDYHPSQSFTCSSGAFMSSTLTFQHHQRHRALVSPQHLFPPRFFNAGTPTSGHRPGRRWSRRPVHALHLERLPRPERDSVLEPRDLLGVPLWQKGDWCRC